MDCPSASCAYPIYQRDLGPMLAKVRWVGTGQTVGDDGEVVGASPATRIAAAMVGVRLPGAQQAQPAKIVTDWFKRQREARRR